MANQKGSVIDFEISTYQVYLANQIQLTGTAGSYCAWIECKGTHGETLDIYFQDDESQTLDNTYVPKQKRGTLFASWRYFPWFVDVLRNEKPVFAYMNHQTPRWNRVHTGREPVGEGEAKPKVLGRPTSP